MFNWLFKKNAPEPAAPAPAEEDKPDLFGGDFSTHQQNKLNIRARLQGLRDIAPRIPATPGVAMDSDDDACEQDVLASYLDGQPDINDAIAAWYSRQTFIGHQLAGIFAQHWLIQKVCDMPGKDAIRHGFTTVSSDGEAIDTKILSKIKRGDKRYKLKKNLREFVNFGRVFGIRIAIYKIDYGSQEADDRAYERPFNIDGVRPGSYKGIIQVDPYWCSPELDNRASSQPDSMHFYEPTHWLINGRRYHRSHLCIYRNSSVVDILKPAYLFGGVPVPQLIMERVYAAERTANEAPLLALTKRTVIFKTDMAKFMQNLKTGLRRVAEWAVFWSNNGVRVIDSEEEHEQIDTSLADMDGVIMSQYQLVAAAGEVPATKLLGTSAKGMNATGEGDESNYHEMLESLQEHELTPFVEGHHQRMIRSDIPDARDIDTTISWEPLDSPTAAEWADINLKRAQTGAALVGSGAIDGHDERIRVANDKDSGYPSLVIDAPIDEAESAVAITAGVPPLATPAAPVEAQA